jgi:flagellar protein FliJ
MGSMSFRFRFDSILQLRRRERDEAGAAVGKANEAIQRIDEQVEAIRLERRRVNEQAARQRVGTISVDSLLAAGRYDLQLLADEHALQQTRGQLVQELERRQVKLLAAEAELKRFERLEENERVAYQAEMLRREQLEADEATSRRFIRQRNRYIP